MSLTKPTSDQKAANSPGGAICHFNLPILRNPRSRSSSTRLDGNPKVVWDVPAKLIHCSRVYLGMATETNVVAPVVAPDVVTASFKRRKTELKHGADCSPIAKINPQVLVVSAGGWVQGISKLIPYPIIRFITCLYMFKASHSTSILFCRLVEQQIPVGAKYHTLPSELFHIQADLWRAVRSQVHWVRILLATHMGSGSQLSQNAIDTTWLTQELLQLDARA